MFKVGDRVMVKTMEDPIPTPAEVRSAFVSKDGHLGYVVELPVMRRLGWSELYIAEPNEVSPLQRAEP